MAGVRFWEGSGLRHAAAAAAFLLIGISAPAQAEERKFTTALAISSKDGRAVAKLTAQVTANYAAGKLHGTYAHEAVGHESWVFIRGDDSTNGPLLDLVFVDKDGGEVAKVPDLVAPLWGCDAPNTKIWPEGHDKFDLALAADAWGKVKGVKLVPHGEWKDWACLEY